MLDTEFVGKRCGFERCTTPITVLNILECQTWCCTHRLYIVYVHSSKSEEICVREPSVDNNMRRLYGRREMLIHMFWWKIMQMCSIEIQRDEMKYTQSDVRTSISSVPICRVSIPLTIFWFSFFSFPFVKANSNHD